MTTTSTPTIPANIPATQTAFDMIDAAKRIYGPNLSQDQWNALATMIVAMEA